MIRFHLPAILCIAQGTIPAIGRPGDTIPPATVNDLTLAATPYGGIALTWTAVGDDGGGPGQCAGAGKAFAYDLRYSTMAPGANISAWFNGAVQATGEPAPLACGSAEAQCVPGLVPGTTYYLALRVKDDANNLSGISNIVSAAPGSATGVMHVESVTSSWANAGGAKKRGHAFVVVLDALGQPVPCATVTVEWSGCYADTASGVTDHTGLARIMSNRTASCFNGQCCFFVTVTGVSHPGFAYHPGANITTTGKASCNPFAPSICPETAQGGECVADCDRSGVLDVADLACFQTAFLLGHMVADCDADRLLNVADFVCFQSRFAAGCP